MGIELYARWQLDGYARGKDGRVSRSRRGKGLDGWYRTLTVREAKLLEVGQTVYVEGWGNNWEGIREARVNGRPRVWKRRTTPGCEVPFKYGLRECFTLGSKHHEEDTPFGGDELWWVWVSVKQPFDQSTPAEIVHDWVLEHELWS